MPRDPRSRTSPITASAADDIDSMVFVVSIAMPFVTGTPAGCLRRSVAEQVRTLDSRRVPYLGDPPLDFAFSIIRSAE